MRAYKAQAEQSGGRKSGGRTERPRTLAQRVLTLQRSVGNASVSRAIEEEQHEHAAGCGHDRPAAEQPIADQAPVHQASADQSSVLDAVRSPGRPLDPRLLARAEQGYGMSFRHVRVHSDPVAQRSAMALGARAYTTGSDIVVGPQGTDDETMFHELDHVRQQSLGSVSGTDNGAGVKLSHQDDPFERHATANGRRMAQGAMPDLSGPGSGASAPAPAPVHAGDGISVARARSTDGRRMYPSDRGQMFEIATARGSVMGRYVRASSDGVMHIFDTSEQGRISVYPDQIIGVRPTVGNLHPPGQVRPPEENLHDRSQLLMSEADLSGVRARLRKNPREAGRTAVTTFEEQPDYQQYETNREDLRRLNVPVINGVDMRERKAAGLVRKLAPNANVHVQMPRTGREAGYSTQKLVRDTNKLPKNAARPDVTVSQTLPHPSMYERESTHNSFYGVLNRKAVPEGMRYAGGVSDEDADLEEYGYGHRQTTKDKGADVAARRKTYRFEAASRSNSPEEEAGPSSYRSRSKSRSRVSETPAPAPSRRRRSSRPPLSRSGRPPAPAAAPVNYAAPEYEDDYPVGSQIPSRSQSRHRGGGHHFAYDSGDEGARSGRRSRRGSVSIEGAYSYGGGPSEPTPAPERERERERGRHRTSSRAPDSRRSSSRAVDTRDAFSGGPSEPAPQRERNRSRRPSSSQMAFFTDSGRPTVVPTSYAESDVEEDLYAPPPKRSRSRRPR
ncbi:DUF4157 domain-containing protein [Streptomyces sp. NPDC085929]|uniref:DUF4157 domain-containing protein n=1 Tax=Streptomyces sp. NPDC085929 TaxID=3365739 RepID=UPI0037D4E6E3